MKSIPLLNEIAIWLIASLAVWGSAYQGQIAIFRDPAPKYKGLTIQVPTWMALLCGKPALDNRVEIGRMISQLTALLMNGLWLLLWLLDVAFKVRMQMLGNSIMFVLLLGALVNIAGVWWARR